jgi:hypothetical protein
VFIVEVKGVFGCVESIDVLDKVSFSNQKNPLFPEGK